MYVYSRLNEHEIFAEGEVRMLVGEQWYWRGNRSPRWFGLASRVGGSPCGICEPVPRSKWPLLERIAKEREDQTDNCLTTGESWGV